MKETGKTQEQIKLNISVEKVKQVAGSIDMFLPSIYDVGTNANHIGLAITLLTQNNKIINKENILEKLRDVAQLNGITKEEKINQFVRRKESFFEKNINRLIETGFIGSDYSMTEEAKQKINSDYALAA